MGCGMSRDPPAQAFYFPSSSADSLLIEQEPKNYPNGDPFKHKPQGPLLIVQLLSQSQPLYDEAGPSTALACSCMPQHAGPACSTSHACSSQLGVGAGSTVRSWPSWHSPSALAPGSSAPQAPSQPGTLPLLKDVSKAQPNTAEKGK